MESTEQLKQIRFKLTSEIEELKDDLREVNKRLYPVGSEVQVKRGKGVWTVTILGFNEVIDPEMFRAEANTGKIHWFNVENIIPFS